MPATPMRADHGQEGVMSVLIPPIRHPQEHVTTPDIDAPMEDATGMIPPHWNTDLLSTAPVTVGQRWGRSADGLIEHPHDGPDTVVEPAFEPPVAWRQVVGRHAKRYRGRFHRKPKRAIARLTLGLETVRSGSSQRYCVTSGAVHTVEREPRSRGSRSITVTLSGSIIPCAVRGRPRRAPGVTRGALSRDWRLWNWATHL